MKLQFVPPTGPQAIVYTLVAILLLVFVVALVPAVGIFDTPSISPFDGESTEAVVVSTEETGREQTPGGVTVVSERIEVRLDSGELVTVERQVAGDDAFAIDAQPGDDVLVTAYEAGGGKVYFIADRLRTVRAALGAGGRVRRGGGAGRALARRRITGRPGRELSSS